WALDAALAPSALSGSGTLSTQFDFLRQADTAPTLAMGLTFDADTLALAGNLASSATTAVAAPGGMTYLNLDHATGAVALAATWADATWTGGFTFEAESAT